MEYLSEFIAIGAIGLLGAMSPGPDFIIVTKNSLMYSRKVGVYTAIGIGFGLFFHIAYSLLGLGLIISQSILLFSIIKYAGAAYLIYLGWKSLKANPQSLKNDVKKANKQISVWQGFKHGFFTNVLNPKATVFFLSVFTQVIDPATPLGIQSIYGLELIILTFAWFILVAIAFSNSFLKKKIMAVQHHVEKAMGAVLIFLGLKVATSANE